jgi:hypothetical protein
LVPEPSLEHLSRLAAALSDPKTDVIDPRFRKPQHHASVSPAEFRDGVASYYTEFGRVDVITDIPGVGGFDVLAPGAKTFDMTNGVTARVADLDAIIVSNGSVNLIWPHLVGLIWPHLVRVFGDCDGLIWPHLRTRRAVVTV